MRSVWMRIKNKFRYAWYLCQYLAALLLLPFLRRKKEYQHLWILSERGTDARDNGLHLMRYISQEHPEISLCYIISRDSKDREKVEGLGRIVNYRTFRHFLVLAAAEVKISTHIMGFSPDMFLFKQLDAHVPMKGIKIFLQHGIIKDDLPYLYGNSVKLDLFVCGAKKEWEYIDRHFGHPKGVARYLGLCRYDRLLCEKRERSNGIILVMPTWRLYISEQANSSRDFINTEYYIRFQEFLSSLRLYEILENYNFRVKFYPHHEMLPYLSAFVSENARVEIVEPKKLDVQEALLEADILLTDYSSVFFDFAYMGKPELFYQFDKAEFRSQQYGEGYFQYEKDGFGPVCANLDEVLVELEGILKANCKMRECYAKKAQRFFEIRDTDNCKRNFEAIYELWKGEL